MAKILVIDDSEDTRNLVKEALSGEHEVFTLESWIHVTEYVFEHNFDLLLVDIKMPGLPGDRLTDVLLKTVKTRQLKIVLFSSIDEEELRQRARDVGAHGYIHKTFDESLLRARVSRFLR